MPDQRLVAISQESDLRHHIKSGVVNQRSRNEETHTLLIKSKIWAMKNLQKNQKKNLRRVDCVVSLDFLEIASEGVNSLFNNRF